MKSETVLKGMYLGQVWKMSLIFIDVCLIQLSTYLILSFKYGVNWPIYFGDDFLKSVLPILSV